MYMYVKKVSIAFHYIMQHMDNSGTCKHYFKNQLAHACTVSSCAHKDVPARLARRVSASVNLRSRVGSRAETYQSL